MLNLLATARQASLTAFEVIRNPKETATEAITQITGPHDISFGGGVELEARGVACPWEFYTELRPLAKIIILAAS